MSKASSFEVCRSIDLTGISEAETRSEVKQGHSSAIHDHYTSLTHVSLIEVTILIRGLILALASRIPRICFHYTNSTVSLPLLANRKDPSILGG